MKDPEIRPERFLWLQCACYSQLNRIPRVVISNTYVILYFTDLYDLIKYRGDPNNLVATPK